MLDGDILRRRHMGAGAGGVADQYGAGCARLGRARCSHGRQTRWRPVAASIMSRVLLLQLLWLLVPGTRAA